ncbi:MAG: hypothetical protein J6Q02_06810 [Lachnospiraceae bacterium]|nr:hypothetical protein [Lachnospiraceae bacterium]
MRRKSISFILIASMILSLAGCGATGNAPTEPEEQIELLEPVNAEVSFEKAAIRDMYDATVYAATVLPVVREYAPEYAFEFGAFGAFEGETVKKGQQLVSANTESIDEQIKAKKEYIASMKEDYEKTLERTQKSVAEYRRQENNAKWAVEQYDLVEEPEQILSDDGSGTMVDNPAYPAWKAAHDRFEGDYRIAKHAADTLELQMDQRTELYELDRKHQEYLLKILQRTRRNAMVTAEADGEIVSLIEFDDYYNGYLAADEPVVAVADMSQMILKCDYVNNNRIKNAQEVYALIDGAKYKVQYQAISSDEYARQSANGRKVYSTFYFADENPQNVEIGDYAVVVVITKRYEQVLSIPKGSIRKDETGRYVYRYEDGKSIRANIQTGFSDGTYTQVLSGLSEGDKVLYSNSEKPNTETTFTLKKGEFHTDFSSRAQLTYSTDMDIKNPVENGTTYFGEYQVTMFQHVNKGDVICTIRVEPDQIALTRNETRLQRLTERLEQYREDNKEDADEEYFIEAVKNYEDQIKEVQEAIAKQKKDFATKTIVAPKEGVILGMTNRENESIVRKNDTVVVLADEGTCYVEVEDTNQMLQYGNIVSVGYKDVEGKDKTIQCKVATMSKIGLSQGLQRDDKKILLPAEYVEEILQGYLAGDWWDRYRFTVEGVVRSMDNVVVVPRSAVYDNGGKTYVYVKDKDGKVKTQFFVSGGYNDSYYWVVEGLTEGMEICSK